MLTIKTVAIPAAYLSTQCKFEKSFKNIILFHWVLKIRISDDTNNSRSCDLTSASMLLLHPFIHHNDTMFFTTALPLVILFKTAVLLLGLLTSLNLTLTPIVTHSRIVEWNQWQKFNCQCTRPFPAWVLIHLYIGLMCLWLCLPT